MSALQEAWESYEGRLRDSDFEQNTLCVIHEDSTPSARVNLDKGLFHCPVCGIGGDVYTLVMAKEGVDFPTAKRIVQDRFAFSDVEQDSRSNAAFTGKRPGRKGAWKPSWLR